MTCITESAIEKFAIELLGKENCQHIDTITSELYWGQQP